MQGRRVQLLGVAVAAILAAGVGTASAGLGGNGQDPSVGEKTGAGWAAEMARTQYGLATGASDSGATPPAPFVAAATGSGSFSFFDDVIMPCSLAIEGPIGCGSATEPEVKIGPDGTTFVTGQEGTPAGIMAWRRDAGSYKYVQLQKPDGIPVVTPATGLTGGGGDNELAIGAPDPDLGGGYRVYTSSLNSLVTNGVEVSTDRGDTWFSNPLASNFVGVDRQWLAASGPKTVWLSYHELGARSVLVVRSDDGGITWGLPQEMFTLDTITETYRIGLVGAGIGNGNVQSNMIALPGGAGVAFAYTRAPHGADPGISQPDPNNPGSFSGTAANSDLWVAISDTSGVRNLRVGSLSPDAVGLFPAIAIDNAGNLYVTASNRAGVFLSTSTDGGNTWSALNEVTAGAHANNASTVFPYLVAGSPGRVALAWLGSSAATPADPAAHWTVQFAYSDDALTAAPTFTVMTASNHVVHSGRICLNGLACSVPDPLDDGRSLAEVVQMGVTNDGRVLISYPDDSTGAYLGAGAGVVEQNGGAGLFATITPTPPPPPPPAGHPTATFTPGASTQYYFTSDAAGLGVGDGIVTKTGYTFDGPSPAPGTLSTTVGTAGHGALIGYLANSTPGIASAVVFGGAPVATDTVLGGNLDFKLWIQNELGAQGATELDFSLLDVAPDGTFTPITGVGAQHGAPVIGGTDPVEVDATFPLSAGGGGWFLPAGDHLAISMTFPFLVASTTRFYYGDATYDAGLKITAGTI